MIKGGGSISWNFEELASTLRAESHDHQPVVVIDEDSDIERSRRVQGM